MLVVDTRLGARNGATVVRVVRRLVPGNRLILTTTHFHPEHVAGVRGFPASTRLIRNTVQQQELDAHGEEMVRMFARKTPQWHRLLAGENGVPFTAGRMVPIISDVYRLRRPESNSQNSIDSENAGLMQKSKILHRGHAIERGCTCGRSFNVCRIICS